MLKLLTKTFFVAVLLVCHVVAHAEDRHWIRLGPEASEVEIIAVDPTTPQIVYAGTHDYGFFKSTTGGSSWDQIGKNAGITRVSALATEYVNTFQLNAMIPANLISTSGAANITVSAESQSSAIFDFYIQTSLVSATLTTNHAGLSFAVDGVTYATAQTFSWEQGSSHTISVTSPQARSGGTRYVFANWSDGGAISHTRFPYRQRQPRILPTSQRNIG